MSNEKREHFCGDYEYDTALCGDPQLGGGTLYISKVTCIPCLQKLMVMGREASDQYMKLEMSEIHTDANKPQCECH